MQACICWDLHSPIWGINNSSPFLFCVSKGLKMGSPLLGSWDLGILGSWDLGSWILGSWTPQDEHVVSKETTQHVQQERGDT